MNRRRFLWNTGIISLGAPFILKAQGFKDPVYLSAIGRAPVASGITYLVDENFEGTGAPSGWTVDSGVQVDFDYATAPAPLFGAQSLRVNAGDHYARKDYTAQTEVWVKFNWSSPAVMADEKIFTLRDSAGAEILRAETVNASGYKFIIKCGTANQTTLGSLTAATTYYIWGYYKVGTGANAGYRIWFSTTDSRPADGSSSSAGGSDGSRTTNAERIYLVGITNYQIFDNVKVAAVSLT